MQWTDYKLLLYSWLKTYSKIAAICSVFNSTCTTISVWNWNCYFRPLSRLRFIVILCSFFTMLNRCAQFSSLQFLFSFCFILCRVLFCRSNVVIFSITFVHVFHRPNLFKWRIWNRSFTIFISRFSDKFRSMSNVQIRNLHQFESNNSFYSFFTKQKHRNSKNFMQTEEYCLGKCI